MKKLTLVLAAALFLTSCGQGIVVDVKDSPAPNKVVIRDMVIRGHNCIWVSSYDQAGILHNPDCKQCKEEKQTEFLLEKH
jgi:hypothetical protein